MPILSSEIKWYNSALISDTTPSQNGGRPSQTVNQSGVKNNIFPDVSAAQRQTGVEHWRKLFICLNNPQNLPLLDARISIERGTEGQSYVLIYPGTWTDTQANRSGRPYGYGTIASPPPAQNDTSLVITTEANWSTWAPTERPFQVGDVIRIDTRPTVNQPGVYEYNVITDIEWNGGEVTIEVQYPLSSSLYAVGSHVASVIAPGTIQSQVTNKVTTGGVTYNDTAYPIVVPQVGGVYQTWTITITNAQTGALQISGDTLGNIGTGAMGVDLQPSNPRGGKYFILQSEGWGGTPQTGDTLTFTTIPAGVPIWYRRVIPAGASVGMEAVSVCVEGES